MPAATVQLVYRIDRATGLKLASDPRLGAIGFTGSRTGGLALKAAADKAGKPIYLELSSINPVVMLPGALAERGQKLAEEFAGSCLLGGGQFCTNPGLVLMIAGNDTEQFIDGAKKTFEAAQPPPLLGADVAAGMKEGIDVLLSAGATRVTKESQPPPEGFRFPATLVRATGTAFLANPEKLQTEVFGAASLMVVTKDEAELSQVIDELEGNLTGSIYSDTGGKDDPVYKRLEPRLRQRVGRLLNDKMPTGVAVSPAMNHGGPYPSTGHAGFTAVGIPSSLRRFAALHCYDNVRPERLPEALRDANPNGSMWRLIDGEWTREAAGSTKKG
jgi:NADP-dependent aldehyde dehydrogenase